MARLIKGRFCRGPGWHVYCACGHQARLHHSDQKAICGWPTKHGDACRCPLTPDMVVDMYNICGTGVDL